MKRLHILTLAGCLMTGGAHASCGAAFCSASNDWLALTQGVAQGWRVWGQVEYLKQDQLRAGTEKISPAEITAHHEEIKTLNRNALLGLEYGFAPDWSANLVLPYSNREHLHIHHHHGTPIPEDWQFDEIGDARLTLRHQPAPAHRAGDMSWSLQGGLKLPTGRTDVRNADGDEAERSVQPGSGTTDLLLGVGLAYAPLSLTGSLFSNVALQVPLDENDGYRPGWRSTVQAGWLIPVTGKLDLVLQGNLLYVARDRGIHAEPDDSGRTEVALVPGLAYAWSRHLSLYGQLEYPIYQNVNGIQLTHDYAVSVGLSLALN
jgi:Putative MetA-pathway of phenol degradation